MPPVYYPGHGVRMPGLDLPAGFRFHPTDEELITHYVTPKNLNRNFWAAAIAEADLNRLEPCELPSNREHYFYNRRNLRYPTGTRTNRSTSGGYWKATGKDREIYKGKMKTLVGMKKTLVFYNGRAPRGEKTPWVMHEFGLLPPRNAQNEWVVCKVFYKRPPPALATADSFPSDDILELGTSHSPLAELDFEGANPAPVAYDTAPPTFYDAPGPVNPQAFAVQDPSSQFYTQSAGVDILTFLNCHEPWPPAFSNAIRQHCKAQQYAGQVSPSCETAVTNDGTCTGTEMSSVVSPQYVSELDGELVSELDGELCSDPIAEFYNIWN